MRSNKQSIKATKNGKPPLNTRILLVQVGAVPGEDLCKSLEDQGFTVEVRNTVKDGLQCMTNGDFAGLICDLHLPNAGDGFTLVNAMRHFHTHAITMILSNYPQLRESVSALLPQADEVLVTPMPHREIVKLLQTRLIEPKHREIAPRESVATILERFSKRTIADWLKEVNQNPAITIVPMNAMERTGHLPTLFDELVERLRKPRIDEGEAKVSPAALAHGTARRHQGYSSSMLVEESRMLQVCIFKTLRNNLNAVDLALVLTDVMTIADEVDSQLAQTMTCFTQAKNGNGKRPAARPSPGGNGKSHATMVQVRTRKGDDGASGLK